jgi:hypothetical protein
MPGSSVSTAAKALLDALHCEDVVALLTAGPKDWKIESMVGSVNESAGIRLVVSWKP